MFNANINGVITVSPKIENITDTPINQNEFGILISELVALAEKPCVVPVLKFPSTTSGKFVEYTMTAFRSVENGYEFKFICDSNVLTLTANTSTNKYSLVFTPFASESSSGVEMIDISEYTFYDVYDHATTETLELTDAILSDFLQDGKVIGVTKDEISEDWGTSYHGIVTGYSVQGDDLTCTFTAKADHVIYSVYVTIFDYADAETRTLLINDNIDTFPDGSTQYAQAMPFYALDFPHTYENADIVADMNVSAVCNLIRNAVDGFKQGHNTGYLFYGLTVNGKQYMLNTISETSGTATVTFSRCDASDAETLTFVITDYDDMALRTLTTSISTRAAFGTVAYKNSTANLTPNSHDLIESGTVYNSINQALSSVYTPRGSIASADLTSALLVAGNLGNIYETTDSGTTTADFLQGAGISYSAGQNIGIIQVGVDAFKFNLMSNSFDLHEYQKQTLTTPLTINGTQRTTVESALSTLKDDKATVTADGVKTTAELIKELVEIDSSKITYRSVLVVQNGTLFLPVTYMYNGGIIFNASTANDTKCHIRNVFYDGTNVHFHVWEYDVNGNAVSSLDSVVPTSGEVFTLIY